MTDRSWSVQRPSIVVVFIALVVLAKFAAEIETFDPGRAVPLDDLVQTDVAASFERRRQPFGMRDDPDLVRSVLPTPLAPTKTVRPPTGNRIARSER